MTAEIIALNGPEQSDDKQDISPKSSIGNEIELFTKQIDAIGHTLISMIYVVQLMTKDARDKLVEFEDQNCTVLEEKEVRKVRVKQSDLRQWRKLYRQFEDYDLAKILLPRSLLVSMVSQYDAYLSRLMRAIYLRKPELLNGSGRQISFQTLNQFDTIEAAREYVLEKEIESVLRSSHSDQFECMEKAFSIELTKGLESWPIFIELTERRNLFVHTDGIVSSQYISVCKQHSCHLQEGLKEGVKLGVPQEYFESAHDCIFEIGVKLGHVLWRKQFPEDREEADKNLLNLAYELILKRRYKLAICILEFATQILKKFASDELKFSFWVNLAQAYKWSGNDQRCKKIMQGIDWSAKSDPFKLADAVLKENWSVAAKIMQRIGKSGAVDPSNYREWPLFRQFRQQEIFAQTYEEIFGEAFAASSEVKTEVNDLDAPVAAQIENNKEEENPN